MKRSIITLEVHNGVALGLAAATVRTVVAPAFQFFAGVLVVILEPLVAIPTLVDDGTISW